MKKAFSLILALTLCMGLATPAFAEDGGNVLTWHTDILGEVSATLNIVTQDPTHCFVYDEDTISGWYVIAPGTEITVANEGNTDGAYGYVYLKTYTLQPQGSVAYWDEVISDVADDDSIVTHEMDTSNKYYSNEGTFHGGGRYLADSADDPWQYSLDNSGHLDFTEDPENNCVKLYSGDKVTFKLPDTNGNDIIYRLYTETLYPETNHYYYTWRNIKVGDMPTAHASAQSVLVDGKSVEFQCYALKDANGNDTNYIKLRDVAMILNGTAAQFEVGWDGAVNIETGKAYTPNGSEMSTPFSGNRSYEEAIAETRINGVAADLNAIVLKDDMGGAFTYYKLRDLGEALGFLVDWSAEKGIFIETE